MPLRLALWGSVLLLTLSGSTARADLIDVATEFLDDGWVRYTYTIEDPSYHGLQSFSLHSEFLQDLREVTQPADWIHHLGEDRLDWSRDVLSGEANHLGDTLVFTFESAAAPTLVLYNLTGSWFLLKDEILGPGPEAVPVTTARTPEPASLGLLVLGGLGLWIRHRRRREPI